MESEIETLVRQYAAEKKKQTGNSCIKEVELDILRAHYARLIDNPDRLKLALVRAIAENKKRHLW